MPLVTLPDGRQKDLTQDQHDTLRQGISNGRYPSIPKTWTGEEAEWQAACRRSVGVPDPVVAPSGPRRRPTLSTLRSTRCEHGHAWGASDAWISVPSRTGGPPGYRRCTCLTSRDLYQRMIQIHPATDGALHVPIGTSPLTTLVATPLVVRCLSDDVLSGHLVSALWNEPMSRRILYAADVDVAQAARNRSFETEKEDAEEARVKGEDRPADTIYDLVAEADLLLLQPGLLGRKNLKRDLIYEALLIRRRVNKPTWLLLTGATQVSKEVTALVAGWRQVAVVL